MFSKIFKNIVEARSLYINRCMFPNITISGILVPVLIHMLLNSLLNFSKKKKKSYHVMLWTEQIANCCLLLANSVNICSIFLEQINIFFFLTAFCKTPLRGGCSFSLFSLW